MMWLSVMTRHLGDIRPTKLRRPWLLCALLTVTSASALELPDMSLGQDPRGKTEQPPMSIESHKVGENTEKNIPPDEVFTLWIQDETFFKPKQEDRVEVKQVLEKSAKTFKLKNVVKPIRFGSGQADIPQEYVTKLKNILDSMKNRDNVRLRFIGHSDSDPLSGATKAKYGDNYGLSKARAEIAAEFFQRELDLPPDAVSYDGAGDSKPIASNATAQGKALNRRVEVQVWYDQITEKAVEKKVVVPAQKLNRIQVCRKEVVCQLHYKEGFAKRVKLRNLVSPLRLKEGQTDIPAEFLRQIRETLKNLGNKQNVVIRFVGHTDNLPLEGTEKRIYGDNQALSRARARRVALAVQDAMKLPNSMISTSGKGASQPVASNDTEKGRALNRRVEVEFWHDDPFEVFSEDPQACPEAAAAETISRVYDPPSGPIAAIRFKHGQPVIPPGYAERLKRLMNDLDDKANVRLSFIGYTSNKRMNRRTAMVYGDDIGLSTARARRVMQAIKQRLQLKDNQAEFEGRGYVQSQDVVSTGFTEFDSSRVEVQILYDELAVLDEDDNLDINRIERVSAGHNPYAMNLMRITVDGQPLYDPYKSSEDLQRCTDVALDKASIRFKFDKRRLKPRLNISAWPSTIRYADDPDTEVQDNRVSFRAYSNYRNFIDHGEVRIFKEKQAETDTPIAVVPLNADQQAEWLASMDAFNAPVMKLKYRLRVYDKAGHYDETESLPLWLVDRTDEPKPKPDSNAELLVGYGENHLQVEHIPLKGGLISVTGENIPKDHSVWLAGRPVPVDEQGRFVTEQLFDNGAHTVEVAVLDPQGNGDLYLRDLDIDRSDWFYVGLADITLAQDSTNGPAELVTGDKTHYDNDLSIDGRLAFFVNGHWGDDWELTSSADTREGPLDEIFTNFMDKSPDALFRRMDSDYFYPTFGDDSTLEELAPTLGKFYVKLSKGDDYGLWGNFKLDYADTELAQIDRGLYGANGHYQSDELTSSGEQKFMLDGFAADPGTLAGRDEFRGTGGSLYFLRHQDILTGSDRVRIEVRDKDSGLVIGVKNLVPAIDYDIDPIQGRIVLSEPLSSIASDNLLVDSGNISGNPEYLVVRYEYTPGFEDINNVTVGGRVHYWLNDHAKLGLTLSKQEESGNQSKLGGVDFTLRKNAGTWLKMEVANTDGVGTGVLNSNDGGFNFDQLDQGGVTTRAGAYRIETQTRLQDVVDGSRGTASVYVQHRDAGFSAPGQLTANDIQQFGGRLNMPVNEKISLNVKADKKDQSQSLQTAAIDVDAAYQLDDNWSLSAGTRFDSRKDQSPTVVATQTQGDRTDVAFQAKYDTHANWSAYGFGQVTANASGSRDDNNRVGAGGAYRVSDRLNLEGELSGGNTGTGAKLGTDYLLTDRTNLYLNYALENERADNGIRSRKGNMASGFRSRYSDTVSIYMEERYAYGDVPTGLTHAAGVDLAPDDKWNYGASMEMGTLEDHLSGADIRRTALGLNVGYSFSAVKYAGALEYRKDETQNTDATSTDRTTWLLKNSVKYQFTPDWRLIGKFNHSDSKSSQGEFYDGNFTEAVLGYGYRPVENDRWNTLFKYTYFYNVPSVDQVTVTNTSVEFIQKSHIASIDTIYDLSQRWSLGGKYAYRLGQVSQERVNPEFFDSRASLYVLRADWHFVNRWDALFEGRLLDLPDAQDRRSGLLTGIYRHVGKNLKFGVGYNFTDFSDDLTDLSFDSQGWFINLVGKL